MGELWVGKGTGLAVWFQIPGEGEILVRFVDWANSMG